MSSVPEFFDRFPITPVSSADLTATLADPAAPPLTILFLWGKDCPNCDIAKRAILINPARLLWLDVRWLHCNVYHDPDMGLRFGLHGIPVFLVFRGSRPLGRMTSWPGAEDFAAAIERQRSALLLAPSS
jgi:hypothetical protein